MCEVIADAEAVLDRAQDAVVVIGAAVLPGVDERADDEAGDGPAGAETVFLRHAALALILIVSDDDDPIGAECGRGLDLRDLALQERVELPHAVVERLAVR